jgi:competence protein ComEC
MSAGLRRRRTKLASALVVALPVLSACGGDSSVQPVAEPPTIQVAGLEDGTVYPGPIAVQVSVDRGTYSVTLDGATVYPPIEVRAEGEHELSVTARASGATATLRLRFRIRYEAPTLIVRFFDLGDNASGGGGDAILLTDSSSAGSFSALVDAGPFGPAQDPGYVARRLAALGVDTLEMVLLTHAHSDHFAGLEPVLRGVHVRRFYHNGQQRSLSDYRRLLSTAAADADSVIEVREPTVLPLSRSDSASVLALVPPLPTYLSTDVDATNEPGESHELNEGSVGVSVAHGPSGGFRMFLAGDGETEANRRWLMDYPELVRAVTVLKVGHHGANNAVFDDGHAGATEWLSFTHPQVAVISANGTTHPRRAALASLLSRPATRTYCTNVHGDVTIRVAPDGSYRVSVERNPASDCVAGTEATTWEAPAGR